MRSGGLVSNDEDCPESRDCSKVDRLWFGRYSGICVDRQNG